ncbi:hypothetical protein B0H10DRAFT_2092717 [Mycena sp. CBHHK59/15]|nr:hypothetical protein B0H10DRAFT_2092717 [Mycena sp. CBHHK59/15]
MAGGLKANWQKDLGLPKPVKNPPRRGIDRCRAHLRHRLLRSRPSQRHVSAGDVIGEFDQEEDESSQMGITLKKKTVVVDVNGKTKREPKRKYTNADLPFPPDGHAADLKHFQDTFIPDLIDWAATLDDPFAANSHPSFQPTVEAIWNKYFTAYKIDAAVEYMAVSALGNWRSDIGKRALKAVSDHLKTIDKATLRREWVADQSYDLAFLYRDPATKGGSYRSELFLRTFGAHLRIVIKSDVSYGHPTGAASLCAAALERALSLCQDGSPSTDGLPRKGKKSVLSFVAIPWADRASKYLTPIKTLTLQKWREIFNLASVFQNPKGNAIPDIFEQSADGTDGGDSSDGYLDPRSRVIVSDDEAEDDGDDDSAGLGFDTVVVFEGEGGLSRPWN